MNEKDTEVFGGLDEIARLRAEQRAAKARRNRVGQRRKHNAAWWLSALGLVGLLVAADTWHGWWTGLAHSLVILLAANYVEQRWIALHRVSGERADG